jgi:hypothetical protein
MRKITKAGEKLGQQQLKNSRRLGSGEADVGTFWFPGSKSVQRKKG